MAMARTNSEGKLCYFDAEGQTSGHPSLYRDGKTLGYSRKQHDKLQTLLGSARKIY
jgi:hypothetical protein